MQGIIYLVSHRNLLCILYMTAIQDIFCVADFLHRSIQNLVWKICLMTEFANQIWRGKLFPAMTQNINTEVQTDKTLKHKQMKQWGANRQHMTQNEDSTKWHNYLKEKLWQWVTGTRWATTRLAPLWKCKAGLKFDQWSLTRYRLSRQLLP